MLANLTDENNSQNGLAARVVRACASVDPVKQTKSRTRTNKSKHTVPLLSTAYRACFICTMHGLISLCINGRGSLIRLASIALQPHHGHAARWVAQI